MSTNDDKNEKEGYDPDEGTYTVNGQSIDWPPTLSDDSGQEEIDTLNEESDVN